MKDGRNLLMPSALSRSTLGSPTCPCNPQPRSGQMYQLARVSQLSTIKISVMPCWLSSWTTLFQ